MKLTFQISEQLLEKAEKLAAESGQSLSDFVEVALDEKVVRANQQKACGSVELQAFGGGGLRPGIDLDNNASLADIMDELTAASFVSLATPVPPGAPPLLGALKDSVVDSGDLLSAIDEQWNANGRGDAKA